MVMREKMGCTRLYTPDGKTGRGVDFTVVLEVTRPQTFQVCREKFDSILMDRAREVGVEVREGNRQTTFGDMPGELGGTRTEPRPYARFDSCWKKSGLPWFPLQAVRARQR